MRPKYNAVSFYGELALFIVILFSLGFLAGYWSVEAIETVEEVEMTKAATHLIPTMAEASAEPVPTQDSQLQAPVIVVEETKAIVPVEEPKTSYTEEDLELLAMVIYQEAGGDACSDDTRLKVGTVVMNRVEDDRFPDTIAEVLLQKQQFGRLHWTGLVWAERAELPQEARAVARAYTIAERVLEGERVLPADVVYASEYVQGEIVAEQDGFYFCR